jgi:hypothetical protein
MLSPGNRAGWVVLVFFFNTQLLLFVCPRGAALSVESKGGARTSKRGLRKVGCVRCGRLHQVLVVFRS